MRLSNIKYLAQNQLVNNEADSLPKKRLEGRREKERKGGRKKKIQKEKSSLTVHCIHLQLIVHSFLSVFALYSQVVS